MPASSSAVAVQGRYRLIPTVVVTAIAKEQVKVIADAVFHKPVEFGPLVSMIHTLVQRH